MEIFKKAFNQNGFQKAKVPQFGICKKSQWLLPLESQGIARRGGGGRIDPGGIRIRWIRIPPGSPTRGTAGMGPQTGPLRGGLRKGGPHGGEAGPIPLPPRCRSPSRPSLRCGRHLWCGAGTCARHRRPRGTAILGVRKPRWRPRMRTPGPP